MGCLISWLAVSDTQETSSRRSVVSLGYLDMSCIKWRDQLNGCALLCDPITNRSHNVIENSDKMTVFFFLSIQLPWIDKDLQCFKRQSEIPIGEEISIRNQDPTKLENI